MSNKGRSNLNVNGLAESALFFDGGQNPFLVKNYSTIINHVFERVDIPVVGTSFTRGSSFSFNIMKYGDGLFGDLWIGMNRAAYTGNANLTSTNDVILSGTAMGGLAPTDWEAYAQIGDILFSYNTKRLWVTSGDISVVEILDMSDARDRKTVARLGLGDLTPYERESSGAAALP